jgi:hypothetical protein
MHFWTKINTILNNKSIIININKLTVITIINNIIVSTIIRVFIVTKIATTITTVINAINNNNYCIAKIHLHFHHKNPNGFIIALKVVVIILKSIFFSYPEQNF